jgi:uncharacterized protein YkwD
VLLLVMAACPGRQSMRLMASVGDDNPPAAQAHGATLKPASATSPDIPYTEYDLQSEKVLLELANAARAKVGAPPLKLDGGLTHAARAHADAMFAARQLSHQFDGELTVPQRLASATGIQLDQEGENVALDFDAAAGHEHLMLSPPHRANLLNPAYNVVGMAVVRSGDRLYIVQDFGHALPTYSLAEWKDRIAASLMQARQQAKQPALARRDLSSADDAACSMAQADQFGTAPVQALAQHYTVLTYTSLHPETLPGNAAELIASHNLRSFSLGACYARTPTYPTGVYWVVLSLD